MKEIKYQVYIEDGYIEGKPAAIYPVSGLKFDSDGKLLSVSFWPNNFEWSRTLESVKLREYTDRKDRKGQEIYEGDVLERVCQVQTDTRWDHDREYPIYSDIPCRGIVEWDGFVYLAKTNTYEDYPSHFYSRTKRDKSIQIRNQIIIVSTQFLTSEVIGNKYLNPELLTT